MNISALLTDEFITFKPNSAVLIVDVSYYTYARFFATRIWFLNQDKGEAKDQDFTLNDKFMEKFRKLYFKNIEEIIRNEKMLFDRNIENILFAIDHSPFSENWRLIHKPDYKGTRKDAHKKNGFNSWDIFRIVKEEMLPAYAQSKHHIIEIPRLEADDVAALLIRELKKFDKTKNTVDSNSADYRKFYYYILANDKDYHQICNDRTILIDASKKYIPIKKEKTISTNMDTLIQKILMGDVSDNIPACIMKKKLMNLAKINSKKNELKCTPAKVFSILDTTNEARAIIYELLTMCRKCYLNTDANKCIKDAELLKKYTELEAELFINGCFTNNARIIDFAQIPCDLFEGCVI